MHPIHEISWQGKLSPAFVIPLKFYSLSFFPWSSFSFSNTETQRQKDIPEILLLCRGWGAECERTRVVTLWTVSSPKFGSKKGQKMKQLPTYEPLFAPQNSALKSANLWGSVHKLHPFSRDLQLFGNHNLSPPLVTHLHKCQSLPWRCSYSSLHDKMLIWMASRCSHPLRVKK